MNENMNNQELNKINENINQNEKEEQNSLMEETNKEIKIEELQKRIEELEKEANEWKEKFLRKAAEFENYKRRTENDQLNLLNYAAESFIKKILPIVDDFERSLEHINESNDHEKLEDVGSHSLRKGVQLIYNKLIKVLDEQGVKKIEALGKPFDVHYHEALMQKADNSVPANTVLEELEKGYMYKDKVIRHAKVVVSSEDQLEE